MCMVLAIHILCPRSSLSYFLVRRTQIWVPLVLLLTRTGASTGGGALLPLSHGVSERWIFLSLWCPCACVCSFYFPIDIPLAREYRGIGGHWSIHLCSSYDWELFGHQNRHSLKSVIFVSTLDKVVDLFSFVSDRSSRAGGTVANPITRGRDDNIKIALEIQTKLIEPCSLGD